MDIPEATRLRLIADEAYAAARREVYDLPGWTPDQPLTPQQRRRVHRLEEAELELDAYRARIGELASA